MLLVKSRLTAVGLLGLAAVTCVDSHAAPHRFAGTSRRIELAATGGKPNAPTERIVIEIGPADDHRQCHAERIGTDGKVTARVPVALTEKQIEALWQQVSPLSPADIPTTLKPAPGYGDRRLTVTIGSDPASANLQLRWSAPLPAASKQLVAAVTALAKLAPTDGDTAFYVLPRAMR